LPFLGIPRTKGKVVYINFELLEGECRRRFLQIQKAMGTGSLDDIEVIQLRGKQLSNLNLEQLERIISDASFVLCSFDPVYKLLDGRDERLGIDITTVLASPWGDERKGEMFSRVLAAFHQGQPIAEIRNRPNQRVELFHPGCRRDSGYDQSERVRLLRIEIIQRSFPEIKSFGIRWQCPIFVRDNSIDAADIQQPGKESKSDPINDRMLAVLHGANSEGGLSFTEFIRAVQVKGPTGKPTPGKTAFCRYVKRLVGRNFIEQSVATTNTCFRSHTPKNERISCLKTATRFQAKGTNFARRNLLWFHPKGNQGNQAFNAL
jgi:hypothetical protein